MTKTQYQNIFLKEKDLITIKEATTISKNILRELKSYVVAGVSPADIDIKTGELCEKFNVVSSFKGVSGFFSDFPSNLCVMVNDETVHAIPDSLDPLVSGDVVKIDMGIIYKGFYTDHGMTIGIEEISKEHKRMIQTVELSVNQAAKQAKPGKKTGDISYILGEVSKLAGFSSVTTYAGHGIGKTIHTGPNISFVGEKNTGEELIQGMLLCIENWITDGKAQLKTDRDGWTDRTKDGSISAFYEQMVIVDDQPIVLTRI